MNIILINQSNTPLRPLTDFLTDYVVSNQEFQRQISHTPFLPIPHHNPILMLMALVCIAALLVPLHHKLEKWATYKLVEKKKAIRLASAKKTIEELEKP